MCDQKKWNQQLADKILIDKAPLLVKHHNEVHQVMAKMNGVASSLSVDVRLQDHELTATSIAVALSFLSQCSPVVVLCMGAELLAESATDPQGPQKALNFLQTHKVEKYSEIPAVVVGQSWSRSYSMQGRRARQ